ncbi:MAG: hypothetical protein FWC91_12630 [Defluviitaleaceae bacterium]|nr:hypothetical protein [Defluviitaleaceae bacterium]
MKCQNINFPALIFTSPGVYLYTIKELTPSGANWKTDDRVYRAVVTVTDNGDGTLDADVDYPDGFPKFVNIHCPPPPPPPCDICKYFDCLPFPMFWFAPPQKPEFRCVMESTPNAFDKWDEALKYLRNYCNKCNKYRWDCLQQRRRDDLCEYKDECFCGKRCQNEE